MGLPETARSATKCGRQRSELGGKNARSAGGSCLAPFLLGHQLNQPFLAWRLKVAVEDSDCELASCGLHVRMWEGIPGVVRNRTKVSGVCVFGGHAGPD